jgi:hypothetical protein
MACDITSGFTLGCRDNVGSIKQIYILSGSVTSTTDASEGLINSITGSAGSVFYTFELFRETSDYAEAVTVAPENGTVVYEQTVNAVFFKMQTSLRNQIKVLAQNPTIRMIVETNNESNTSKYVYVGEEYGMQLLTSAGGTGTLFGDRNGYTLTFTGREPNPAAFISASSEAELLALLTDITIS